MAAPAVVQSKGATATNATSVVVTPSAATTAGNLLVLAVNTQTKAATSLSVTDSAGNAWTAAQDFAAGANNQHTAVFFAANAASVTSVTLTSTQTGVLAAILIEASGVATISPQDTQSEAQNSNTAISQSASGATTTADDFVVIAIGLNNPATMSGASAGWTVLPQETASAKIQGTTYSADLYLSYETMTAIGTPSFSATASANGWAACMVAFKAAASGTAYTASITQTLTAPSDSLARVVALKRSDTETLSLADSVARRFTGHRTMSESLAAISDSILAILGFHRSTSEALTTGDATARRVALKRRAAETTSTSDSLSRLTTLKRGLSETLAAISDSAVAHVIYHYIAAISEALPTLADAVARRVSLKRAATETLPALTDALARRLTALRTATETLGVTDAVARLIHLGRAASESLSVSDALARLAALRRGMAETLSLSDAVARLGAFRRSASVALAAITDSISTGAVQHFVRSIAEGLPTLADSLARRVTQSRAVAVGLTTVDSLARQASLRRAASEPLAAIVDAAARVVSLRRSASESLSAITDAVTRRLTARRSLSETGSTADTLARRVSLKRAISDALAAISDSAVTAGVQHFVRAAAETLSLADSVARLTTLRRGASETLAGLTDGATRRLTAARQMAETLAITDALARGGRFVRGAVESLSLTDALGRRFAAIRGIGETLGSLIDRVRQTFAAKSGTVTFNASAPSVTFATSAASLVLATSSPTVATANSVATVSFTTSAPALALITSD